MPADGDMQLILSPEELTEVKRILQVHVPTFPVWAFGSRVTGNCRKFSDLDIAVITKEPLSLSCMADLQDAFSESDLVFKVDVVDWATTSDAFRKIIEEQKIVIQTLSTEDTEFTDKP